MSDLESYLEEIADILVEFYVDKPEIDVALEMGLM